MDYNVYTMMLLMGVFKAFTIRFLQQTHVIQATDGSKGLRAAL